MVTSRSEFNLFEFLDRLNRREIGAYRSLSDESKKAAHPLVIMRWLSGTSNEAQIVQLNEFANRYVFSLGQHKELLFQLLAASCSGRAGRVSWLKGPTGSSTRLALEAIKAGYDCSTREAEGYLGLLDAADIVLLAEDAGWEKDQLKKLALELGKNDTDTGPRVPAKSRAKPKK